MHRIAIAALAGLVLGSGVRADDKGTDTEIDGLKSTAPARWKSEKPGTPDRVLQFTIPREDGDKYDGQLLVFYFRGQGGSAADNIKRWKGMITPAEGTKEDDAYKTSEFKVGDVMVTQLDARGTYIFKRRPFDPNEKGEPRSDYRLIGAVFESKNGPYFIRLVGPRKTIDANRKGFEDWLKNFK